MSNQNNTWYPGHVYRQDTGTGIKLLPESGRVELYAKGELIKGVAWQGGTAWDFWYSLAFVELFPEVTHWWFGSAWTQRVRATRQIGTDPNTGAAYGYIQFIDGDVAGNYWYVGDAQVDAPMPPYEERRDNLPLHIALCRLVKGVHDGNLQENKWYTVTSLVPSEELTTVFPEQWLETWYPSLVQSRNMRSAFCMALGLQFEK